MLSLYATQEINREFEIAATPFTHAFTYIHKRLNKLSIDINTKGANKKEKKLHFKVQYSTDYLSQQTQKIPDRHIVVFRNVFIAQADTAMTVKNIVRPYSL